MAQMRAAARAVHLGARHPIAVVDARFDRALDRNGEARPASAALEFGRALKQRLPAAGAGERARPLLVKQRTTARDSRCRVRA